MSRKERMDNMEQAKSDTKQPQKMSRRTMLRNVAVGAPAVLTLHSGAALARSSNMVGAAPAGTRDMDGNALCLDTRTAKIDYNAYQVDLGEPARGRVNVLSDRAYYSRKSRFSRPRSADMVCKRGGTYYYRDDGWHEVNLPRNGVIVSATAMVSVSLRGGIQFNRIA